MMCIYVNYLNYTWIRLRGLIHGVVQNYIFDDHISIENICVVDEEDWLVVIMIMCHQIDYFYLIIMIIIRN